MTTPHADQLPLEAVLDAGRELGAAAVLFHARIAEHLGLGPSDTEVLDVLREHGPTTPKQLGELTGLAPATITGVVDRLAAHDLASRHQHPDDGRRVLVTVAPGAEAQLWPLYAGLVEGLSSVFEQLDDDQLRFAADLFRRIAAAQRQAAANIS